MRHNKDDDLVDEVVDTCTDLLYLRGLIRRHASSTKAAATYLGVDYHNLHRMMDGSLHAVSHEQILTYIDAIKEAVELGVIIG